MDLRIQQHKVWMLRHVVMGYAVAFQRFLMFVVGPMLHALLWERFSANDGIETNSTDAAAMPRMLTSLEMQQWYNVTSLVAMTIPPLLVEWGVIRRASFRGVGVASKSTSRSTLKRD